MTVSSTTNRVAYAGAGTANPLAVAFPFQAQADLLVIKTVVATGVSTTLALTTDYTITGTPDASGFYPNGGSVVPVATIPVGTTWTIIRDPVITQEVNVVDNDPLPAASIENPVDKLTMICQRLKDRLDRTIHTPDGDAVIDMLLPSAVARGNRVSVFNSSGGADVSSFNITALEALMASFTANPVNSTAYVPPFTGGIARTIGDKLAECVSITDFGASTLSSNNRAAIQAALDASLNVFIPPGTFAFNGNIVPRAGTTLFGCGLASKFSGDNVLKIDVSANNVYLHDFAFIGDGSQVIAVGKNASADKVRVERVWFVPTIANHLDQCVSIYDCSNVHVDDCTFVSTGYGVIQQSSHAITGLKVTNCIFADMYGDAVLLNGAGSGHLAIDVLVQGNSFLGSHDWTTPATERRFVGVTSAYGVRILDNWVTQCAGDAAIHLEEVGGRCTISGNQIVDCGVNGGNDGYIYYAAGSDAKTTIISNNWFVRTSASAGTAFISTQSNAYINEILVIGNHFQDTTGHHVIALNLASHAGLVMVHDNFCTGCDQFVQLINADGISIKNNDVLSTNYGVYSSNVGVASGAGGSNIEVVGNTFYCLTYSLRTGKNTSGTNGPSKWQVVGNAFKTGDVLGSGGTDCFMSGNTFGSTLVNNTMASGAVARCVETGLNFKDGTGAV